MIKDHFLVHKWFIMAPRSLKSMIYSIKTVLVTGIWIKEHFLINICTYTCAKLRTPYYGSIKMPFIVIMISF